MSRDEKGQTLRLGIAGLGTVGAGLIHLIDRQNELRLPGKLEVVAVSARNRNRKRDFDIGRFRWIDDPVDLAKQDDVDVLVELVGGSDGPAKLAVEAALKLGKPVVTANKALIAEHGLEISRLAEAKDVHLLFEAAVAGAVPIVRALRTSLSGVVVGRVSGILNGTCNYILSEMLAKGTSYEEALADAQRLGFAESDPYLDVSGMDAAHKILILAAIAFGARPEFNKVQVEGVSEIEPMDIALSDKFGFRVKLLAEAYRVGDGVGCRVAPVLIKRDHPLAQTGGALNAVVVESEPVGLLTFTGPGAGAGPTAAAVMGDLSRLFEGRSGPPLGKATDDLDVSIVALTPEDDRAGFYIGARLPDRSGVIAALTEALADEGVSIDKLIQDSAGEDNAAPVAIITHPCSRGAIGRVLERIRVGELTLDIPRVLRIAT